jgi:hypothetical protein
MGAAGSKLAVTRDDLTKHVALPNAMNKLIIGNAYFTGMQQLGSTLNTYVSSYIF